MIGPEQGKKPGKSGKKKSKAKKAKRQAAAIDLTTPTAPDPGAELLSWIDRVQARVDHLLTLVEPAGETPAAAPEPATPRPAAMTTDVPGASGTPTTSADVPAASGTPATPAAAPEPARAADHPASPLAEAWARRQETAEAAAIEAVAAHHEAPPLDDPAPLDAVDAASGAEDEDDDEPFEPGDARLTAVLVARELIARGESAADVRRRLRDGYGVLDPEAVLAQVA